VLVGSAAAPVAATLASCSMDVADHPRAEPSAAVNQAGAERGRLSFRPPPPPRSASPRTGRFEISGVAGAQPAQVYVPDGSGHEPLRLVVMLHGAGGVASSALHILRDAADRHRLLLLAPKSTAASWDVIAGGYGPDVRNLDRLLTQVAARYPLREYTVGGFSDGASYALSLGLTNGDVFDSVIAFSPGFEAAESATGRPRIFVSHGTHDQVLPISRCSRRIVPALEKSGYQVTYHEFDGGHAVPEAMQRSAVMWLDGEAPS
jgi:predicted esterase